MPGSVAQDRQIRGASQDSPLAPGKHGNQRIDSSAGFVPGTPISSDRIDALQGRLRCVSRPTVAVRRCTPACSRSLYSPKRPLL